jgi:GNAT superfamily N-acetyltransferase
MTIKMRIVRAKDTDQDLQTVLGLIDEARIWLQAKGMNQWASPWPDKDSRDARVRRGLAVGKTWIVWHDDIPAATVTIATRPNTNVWPKHGTSYDLSYDPSYDLSERAVYAHRLITARDYANYGLGAQLIDWAGLRGRHDYGAKWIRIDVWTTNTALHNYYLNIGFTRCGTCADRDYPSRALFQKPVSGIGEIGIPQFTGSSAEFDLLDLRAFGTDRAGVPEYEASGQDRILITT